MSYHVYHSTFIDRVRPKPVVGQIVYCYQDYENGRDANGKIPLYPLTVLSVGRKWFKCGPKDCEEYEERTYSLEDWREDAGGYTSQSHLYTSLEEFADESAAREIAVYLSGKVTPSLPLATLRQIRDLVDAARPPSP